MEYTLQPDETVSAGTKRIVRGKVETAFDHIDGDMDRHETVHEVRKRCEEVRAALRLVRGVLPSYSAENAHYRDAAALIETFDGHVEPAVTDAGEAEAVDLQACRGTLVDRRDRLTQEMDLDDRLTAVREELVEGLERVDRPPIATEGYDAVVPGLCKSYRRPASGWPTPTRSRPRRRSTGSARG